MITRPVTHSDWGRVAVVCMRQSCVNDYQAYDSLRLGQASGGVHEGEICIHDNQAYDSLRLGQARGSVHEATLAVGVPGNGLAIGGDATQGLAGLKILS